MYRIETERGDLFDVNMMIAMQVTVTGKASEQELTEAFRYEFANHECQFIRDDEAVCAKVGLTYAEVQADPELRKIYDKAWKLFWADCIKNDWF